MIRVLLFLGWLWPASALAEQILVAVAANFAEVGRQLEAEFEQRTGHPVELVLGSTGKLTAQIMNGAPFDVLLAADQASPQRLADAGFAVTGSQQTYAIGRLALWTPDSQRLAGGGEAVLRAGEFRSLAIANPRLAPYGAAALDTLKALGVHDEVRERIVMGENVGQAYAMVASGNAELGLVALSAVRLAGDERPGSAWQVPAQLHAPIRQDAVLLTRAAGNATARAFLEFLQSDFARERIQRYGYRVDRRREVPPRT